MTVVSTEVKLQKNIWMVLFAVVGCKSTRYDFPPNGKGKAVLL